MVQIGKKVAAGPKKGKKALTFTIDCAKPVEDKVRWPPLDPRGCRACTAAGEAWAGQARHVRRQRVAGSSSRPAAAMRQPGAAQASKRRRASRARPHPVWHLCESHIHLHWAAARAPCC